jgi:hypothetical protein
MERDDLVLWLLACVLIAFLLGSSISGKRMLPARPANDSSIPVFTLEVLHNPNLPAPYNLSVRSVDGGVQVSWETNGSAHLAVDGDHHRYRLAGWDRSANRSERPKKGLARVEATNQRSYHVFVPIQTHKEVVEYAVYLEVVRKEDGVMWISNMSRLPVNETEGTVDETPDEDETNGKGGETPDENKPESITDG